MAAREKLKLLFAGYNGTRNTGSDARGRDAQRQIRHIMGADKVELSVMSQNFDFSKGYFKDTRQVFFRTFFHRFWRRVPQHHGVVACEGSMFKANLPMR